MNFSEILPAINSSLGIHHPLITTVVTSLRHVKGHQDRTARAEDLLLETRLNVECNEMAKEAVRGSITRELRDKRQQLSLETECVFIAGRK